MTCGTYTAVIGSTGGLYKWEVGWKGDKTTKLNQIVASNTVQTKTLFHDFAIISYLA